MNDTKKGFTLLEVLVTLMIFLVLGIATVYYFSGARLNGDLTDTAAQATAVLRQAQVDAASQKNDTPWGVYFSNGAGGISPFYALISSSTYSSSTVVSQYVLPSTVGFVTSTIPQGSTMTVVFNPISGASSVSTTVEIYSTVNPSLVEALSISGQGFVSYSSATSTSSGPSEIWTDYQYANLGATTSTFVLQAYSPAGTLAASISTSTGSSGGQFGSNGPGNLAQDSSGNIYVLDPSNERIEKYNSQGQFTTSLASGYSDLAHAEGIAVDSAGNIYVTINQGSSIGQIDKFSSSGSYTTTYGSYGTGNAQFKFPAGIAIDSSGDMWVLDSGNARIEELNPSGTYVQQITCATCIAANWNYDIAIDSSGNIWTSNPSNGKVTEFSSSGSQLSQFTVGGYDSDAIELIVDSSGNVWMGVGYPDGYTGVPPPEFDLQKFTGGTNVERYEIESSTGATSASYSGNFGMAF